MIVHRLPPVEPIARRWEVEWIEDPGALVHVWSTFSSEKPFEIKGRSPVRIRPPRPISARRSIVYRLGARRLSWKPWDFVGTRHRDGLRLPNGGGGRWPGRIGEVSAERGCPGPVLPCVALREAPGDELAASRDDADGRTAVPLPRGAAWPDSRVPESPALGPGSPRRRTSTSGY